MESIGWTIFWWCIIALYICFVHMFAIAGILLLLYGEKKHLKKG